MELRGNEIWEERHIVGYLSRNSDGWMLFATDHRLVYQADEREAVFVWAKSNRETLLID